MLESHKRSLPMRPIAIVGAPSSIGIRPYDDGGIRRLDLAPRVLRDQHLVDRLAAHDHGDVDPPPYHDIVLAELLTPLTRHPRALGLELTIYDPTLDPSRTCAARLVTLLERVLAGKG